MAAGLVTGQYCKEKDSIMLELLVKLSGPTETEPTVDEAL